LGVYYDTEAAVHNTAENSPDDHSWPGIKHRKPAVPATSRVLVPCSLLSTTAYRTEHQTEIPTHPETDALVRRRKWECETTSPRPVIASNNSRHLVGN